MRNYCLSSHHEDGKHKARVFAAALGLGRGDAEWLRERLLEAAASQPALVVPGRVRDSVWSSLRGRLSVDHCVRFSRGEERLDYTAFRGLPAVNDLLSKKECHAMELIPLLALVALTEDLPDHKLTRGQIGTVVELLERDGEHALLVEFSDE